MGIGFGFVDNVDVGLIIQLMFVVQCKFVDFDEIMICNVVSFVDFGCFKGELLFWVNIDIGSVGVVMGIIQMQVGEVICCDFIMISYSFRGVFKYCGMICLMLLGEWKIVSFVKQD